VLYVMKCVQRLRAYLDPFDLFFGIFPAAASYAAFAYLGIVDRPRDQG
jgi:hypothetical protein